MRTLWLLNELGVVFEVVEWPFDKTLRSVAFLALNPAGRVPALEIDGETLWETGAITELLCERYTAAALGRAPGHPERARWLTWVHFAETISQHAAALTQQHIVLREDAMRSPIVMRLEAKRLSKCYRALESVLETPSDTAGYLLPSGFTAADISVGQAIYMARHFASLSPFPSLERWYERISQREGFRRSLPTGDLLYTRDFYPPWDEA